MAEPTDQELLNRIQQAGDVQAYGRLVARHQQRVYATAYALLGDWSEAQDVAQEVFIRAYVGLSRLRDVDRFVPWLRQITVATCADWRRKGWPFLSIAPDTIGQMETGTHVRSTGRRAAADPAEAASLAEELDLVLSIIGRLPANQRLPLVLHLVDELSPQEVAQVLRLPRGTVRSLIHRGKAAVLAELERQKKENPPMMEKRPFEQELPSDFVYRVLTDRSIKVVELALQEAFRRDHSYLGTEHVLVGLAQESQGAAGQVLRDHGVTADRVREEIDILLKSGPNVQQNAGKQAPALKDVAHGLPTSLPPGAVRALGSAMATTLTQGQTRLTPETMLSAMTGVECLGATILQRLGVKPKELAAALGKALED